MSINKRIVADYFVKSHFSRPRLTLRLFMDKP
ncbi:hypothetical protein KL86DPRO_10212 [uncultured delta proteobacterium]|uniref:Uncharacterized protein n=1 Tax=uncultured delta proteobacterium TaxID=34034 RepID=A0A212IWL1_9DELT|nr:hypothetical protein KL86DPRO_10212 [uncultured delta proteobacterium]